MNHYFLHGYPNVQKVRLGPKSLQYSKCLTFSRSVGAFNLRPYLLLKVFMNIVLSNLPLRGLRI